MIELSHGPGDVPLFLVHAIGGTVFAYLPLAGELASTFRVYGLEAPGLSGPAGLAGGLDDLVSDYTKRIRAKQASGPYYLAGWSMGGVLAYEIASRLERAGHQVALLALLDAPFAMPGTARPGDRQLAGRFLADAARSLGWDTAELPDPRSTATARQLAWLAERMGAEVGDDQLRQRFDVFRAHSGMLAGYQPVHADRPQVRAPALVISADHSPNAPTRDLWPSLLSDPQVIRYGDADHYTLLQPPHARQIAVALMKI